MRLGTVRALIRGLRQGADEASLRGILAADTSAKKKMVVMLGPPAAGKGFFLGEPEKDKDGQTKKYKTEQGEEKETTYGYKLPKSTQGLFTDEDIPSAPDQDESDNHLRAIQYEEAKKHYDTLTKAHSEGKEAFSKALEDHWYSTKDGKKVSLGDHLKYEEFEGEHTFKDFFKKTNTSFYVSMRGWHDDASKKNPETGKSKERFKDEARHRFDDRVRELAERDEASNLMIVDSAGEDIDTQDFKGQIEHAKAAGYEVTVIFLHPEQADTELSNLSRGKVSGKRMVDQEDITNWYKKNEAALKAVQEAAPHNFLHYRKGPPSSDPKEAEKLRKKAREQMNKLAEMSDEDKKTANKEIAHTLYAASAYQLNEDTSYGQTMKGLPKKPKSNIAEAVKKMNEEAEARVGDGGNPESKKTDEKPKDEGEAKDEGEKTRIKFLDQNGDKEVANPNFNPKHKEGPSNPRKRKIRNLPWEDQKKYYQQWARTASHTPRVVQAARVVGRWRLKMAEEETKGWLHGWMTQLAKEIESEVQAEDYTIKAKAGKGPLVYVTLEGGEGDVSTLKKIKPEIQKLAQASIAKHVNDSAFKVGITSGTKGDDMVIAVEVIFPKG